MTKSVLNLVLQLTCVFFGGDSLQLGTVLVTSVATRVELVFVFFDRDSVYEWLLIEHSFLGGIGSCGIIFSFFSSLLLVLSFIFLKTEFTYKFKNVYCNLSLFWIIIIILVKTEESIRNKSKVIKYTAWNKLKLTQTML